MLGIEITNTCNFKCYFCENRHVTKHTHLSNKTFEKIIDEASELGINTIKLTPSDGEIFTDSSILQKLEYVENSKLQKCIFVTNFSLVTPKIQDKLITFKKIEILISDYGEGDEEAFKFLTRMTSKDFIQYQQNIEYAKKINLQIQLCPRGLNYDFSYDNVDDQTIDDKYRTSKSRNERTNLFATREGVCSQLYCPRIFSNGDFSYCTCAGGLTDLNKELIYGNIYTTSLSELYLSSKRLVMINEQSKNIYCNACKTCESFSKHPPHKLTLSVFKNLAKIKKNYENIKFN